MTTPLEMERSQKKTRRAVELEETGFRSEYKQAYEKQEQRVLRDASPINNSRAAGKAVFLSEAVQFARKTKPTYKYLNRNRTQLESPEQLRDVSLPNLHVKDFDRTRNSALLDSTSDYASAALNT